MSAPNDTIFIYILQRISDKAILYVGSSKIPKVRFGWHRLHSPYSIILSAFANNDIRFMVISSTDENHRFEVEHKFWKQFIDAGHPIQNADPALLTWKPGEPSWHKGQKRSPESRAKMSAVRRGISHSPETRAKLSEINKGRTLTPEARAKISAANKGKILSAEVRAKLSAAKKGKPGINKGKKFSAETRAKMSLAQYARQKREHEAKKHDE